MSVIGNTLKGIAFSLTVCAVGGLSSAQADDNKLIVGTEPSFAPFEYLDPVTKEIVGFDIDLIREIAKTANYEVEIVLAPFDGLIPAVLSSSMDCAISAFTITDERKKRVDFSDPYCKAGLGIMIQKADTGKIKNIDDLKNKTICAQIGTSGAMRAGEVEGATVTQFNSASETYLELNKGGCAAIINDRPVHEFYLSQTKDENLALLPEYLTSEEYGIIYRKGNQDVANIISKGFDKVKADGTYDKIYAKWFSNTTAEKR